MPVAGEELLRLTCTMFNCETISRETINKVMMVIERMGEANSDVFFFVVLGVYIIFIHITIQSFLQALKGINIHLSQLRHHKPLPASLGTP